MIPDDLIITKRSSKKQICRVTIEALVQSDTLLPLIPHPKGLTSMALLWLPYLWRPYLWWPYLWESNQVFQPTKPIKVLKQKHSWSGINGASKKANESVCIDYQPGKQEWLWCTRRPSLRYTRPLFLRCVLRLQRLLPLFRWTSSLRDLLSLFGAWDHSLYSIRWAYKGCYFSLREYEAYTVLWNLQECYNSPGHLVATVIELLELSLQG